MTTLGDALPQECARVRKLKELYLSLPNAAGQIAAMLMEITLRKADQAMIEGDTVAMLRIYQDLKDFTK